MLAPCSIQAMLDTSQSYRLSERLLPKVDGNSLLVLDPDTLAVHEFNSTLTAVAQMCDGQRSCEEIVVTFAKLCSLSIADASREVYRALKILRDKDLFDT
ncbi:PqqD family protein [Pseudomonadota bacterium]